MTQTKNKAWRGFAAAVGAGARLLAAGAAQAALQDRDLDGNGQVDAFYDTDLNITWLRYVGISGGMNWETAVAWAEGFTFAGYSDWRLPSSDQCISYNCTGSEMGHLWYVELGNTAGSFTNAGGFLNFFGMHWSGAEFAANPIGAMFFDFYGGLQAPQDKSLILTCVQ